MKLKYLTVITILFLLIESANCQTTISINPTGYFIQQNGFADVVFYVNNITNLQSHSITVKFNNNIVKIISIIQGNFMPNSMFGFQPILKYVYDSISIDQGILGSAVSGSGILFTIRFQGLINGVSPLIISNFHLWDLYHNTIPASAYSGNITVGNVIVNTKIFLQGPFNTSTGNMNTSLCSSGYLPLSQPYNVSPWNYSGTENVPVWFYNVKSTIVDWVLIEIRTTPSGPYVSRKAAFIKDDGSIVDYTDGTILGAAFTDLLPGNYYIVIRHRNHIAVMCSGTVALNTSSSLYDFSTGLTQFYGGDAKMLATNKYGLYGGDANKDGQITSADFNLFNPDNRQALCGYLITDFNLDGMVTSADFNLFNPNNRNAITSNVP